jgi:amino acid transporter
MSPGPARLRRSIGLWDLVFYGIVMVQPTAPMPLFGIVGQEARGHTVTAVFVAGMAMLLTALSYGRMAAAHPNAGSAYTYAGRELHPSVGFLTGWAVILDYLLNPVISTIWCAKALDNIVSGVPFAVWVAALALLFTFLNLQGIRTSARASEVLVIGMAAVITVFLIAAARHIFGLPPAGAARFTRPFYDAGTFSFPLVATGTSIALLTYIGLDGMSTLSEEVENPRRNILRAMVTASGLTVFFSCLQVYAGQLVWPEYNTFADVDTAFVQVAGRAGGPVLFQVVNLTLLVATVGSGMGSQLAAARLLYGMGRDNAIPSGFFGAIEPKRGIPRNNVLFTGALILVGALTMSYQFGAELLNFGAFIAFMGVNASAFRRAVRDRSGVLTHWVPPVLGFLICFAIWLNLRTAPKLVGGAWMALGLVYAAVKTGGFRRTFILSDPPPD